MKYRNILQHIWQKCNVLLFYYTFFQVPARGLRYVVLFRLPDWHPQQQELRCFPKRRHVRPANGIHHILLLTGKHKNNYFCLLNLNFDFFQIVSAVSNHERALREQAKKMNVESLRANQVSEKKSYYVGEYHPRITECFRSKWSRLIILLSALLLKPCCELGFGFFEQSLHLTPNIP